MNFNMIIDQQVKKHFKSWSAFERETKGLSWNNGKTRINKYINMLNGWLDPLGLEIQIVLKKQRRDGKNIKTPKQ